jgi:hypothetical protein
LTIEAQVKAERSRHIVIVTPPAVERAGAAWEMVGPKAVVICADHEQAALWADLAPPELRAHAVTGLTRTAALLKEGRPGVLTGAPSDLAALVGRAALKLDAVDTVVLAWPESFATDLDSLLAEAPDARRVILSWNPPALADFLDRHAHRAEIVGDLPLDPDGKPLGPVCSARYVVVSATRRAAAGGGAVRDVLDTLRPARPYIWRGGAIESPEGGADTVVCAVLPTRAEMQGLAAIGQPVVLALASQLAYLRTIASLTPVGLAGARDRAQDRASALRERVSARLEQGDIDAELALLQPLFEQHDPAEVAGALLAISRQPSALNEDPEPPVAGQWVKVFVTIGRKDRAAPKDLVGALIREVGLDKGQIGRIEMKDTFSLIDVAAAVAEQAARRLTGVSIRGKRATARLDRGG